MMKIISAGFSIGRLGRAPRGPDKLDFASKSSSTKHLWPQLPSGYDHELTADLSQVRLKTHRAEGADAR
ncbi:hypothetical protein TNCV_2102441 [Trichonephila clavipes]|nr:hypothetical protein TNCV_2102441 [Trichonephila clavipes]